MVSRKAKFGTHVEILASRSRSVMKLRALGRAVSQRKGRSVLICPGAVQEFSKREGGRQEIELAKPNHDVTGKAAHPESDILGSGSGAATQDRVG